GDAIGLTVNGNIDLAHRLLLSEYGFQPLNGLVQLFDYLFGHRRQSGMVCAHGGELPLHGGRVVTGGRLTGAQNLFEAIDRALQPGARAFQSAHVSSLINSNK
ncbi:MAG: hypothetical protein VXX53_11700, partial [Pseudomonadota bacterium]|nr:hypothetical protein [Pseudomonadota bacterium]